MALVEIKEFRKQKGGAIPKKVGNLIYSTLDEFAFVAFPFGFGDDDGSEVKIHLVKGERGEFITDGNGLNALGINTSIPYYVRQRHTFEGKSRFGLVYGLDISCRIETDRIVSIIKADEQGVNSKPELVDCWKVTFANGLTVFTDLDGYDTIID